MLFIFVALCHHHDDEAVDPDVMALTSGIGSLFASSSIDTLQKVDGISLIDSRLMIFIMFIDKTKVHNHPSNPVVFQSVYLNRGDFSPISSN